MPRRPGTIDGVDACIREPAVAGRFYPGHHESLRAELQGFMPDDVDPQLTIAMVGPHAGYMYCGSILGETYARTVVPPRVILLCPNHTGRGVARSLWPSGGWRLPSGTVPVDDDLVAAVERHCGATPDQAAHLGEHAIEVHLPFAHAYQPDLRIAALCLAGLDVDACEVVGRGLARVVTESPEPVLLIASTDMSHFLSASEASHVDHLAIDRVTALDPSGLFRTVRDHRISMCGVIPTTVALFAARALGAREAQLVRYGHSGQVSGDHDRVVGYAGFRVY
ncbi:MAG: AmmeMemoRadiSam system protein B [Myxococcota bacterium]